MIHESCIITSSKQKGALRNCTRWKAVIGRGGRDKERADSFIFLWGMERVYVADHLITADRNILDWPVKTTFLEKVESKIKLGIKLWFGDMGLAQVTPFGSYYFFFNTLKHRWAKLVAALLTAMCPWVTGYLRLSRDSEAILAQVVLSCVDGIKTWHLKGSKVLIGM